MKHQLLGYLMILFLGVLSPFINATEQPSLKLWYQQPATYFEESMPLGNGRLGALVYGGIACDSLQLNDLLLWAGKPFNRDDDQFAHEWIPKIRQALFFENINLEENYWHAEQANLSELTSPLFGLMRNIAENGRYPTRNYYGIDRGFCSSHVSDIWAETVQAGEEKQI